MIRWLVYEQAAAVPMIGGLRFRLLTHRLSLSDADAMRVAMPLRRSSGSSTAMSPTARS